MNRIAAYFPAQPTRTKVAERLTPEQSARAAELRRLVELLDEQAGACLTDGQLTGLIMARDELLYRVLPDVIRTAVYGPIRLAVRSEVYRARRTLNDLSETPGLSNDERAGIAIAAHVVARRHAELNEDQPATAGQAWRRPATDQDGSKDARCNGLHRVARNLLGLALSVAAFAAAVWVATWIEGR